MTDASGWVTTPADEGTYHWRVQNGRSACDPTGPEVSSGSALLVQLIDVPVGQLCPDCVAVMIKVCADTIRREGEAAIRRIAEYATYLAGQIESAACSMDGMAMLMHSALTGPMYVPDEPDA